jgi:hypothetical protein
VWKYDVAGEGIVGQPQLVDGLVVVADVAGHFVALNPANGEPVGPGYTLRASVAPAATPAPFGEGRALVPLTDGTFFILYLDKLRGPNSRARKNDWASAPRPHGASGDGASGESGMRGSRHPECAKPVPQEVAEPA